MGTYSSRRAGSVVDPQEALHDLQNLGAARTTFHSREESIDSSTLTCLALLPLLPVLAVQETSNYAAEIVLACLSLLALLSVLACLSLLALLPVFAVDPIKQVVDIGLAHLTLESIEKAGDIGLPRLSLLSILPLS